MRLIKSGVLVFSSEITQNILVLVRNTLLARLLTVEQFGIAATFTIMLTLVDAAQNAGIGRMIVQARDGDDERFQKTLHLINVALGGMTAIIIALASYPYALAMGTPHIVGAYLIVALIPLLRGFGHLDPQRLQRQHRFGPMVARQLVPQIASTLAIWPLFLLFGDYRVIIASMLLAQLMSVIMTHIGAERRFGFAFDREVVSRAVSFGMPLMLNGILLFLVLNGDRMIVSNQFGHTVLGAFSGAFMLTLMPTMLIANSTQSLLLPRMSQVQDDKIRLQRVFDATASALMVLTVVFVAGTALLGPFFLTLLFGSKYEPAGIYMAPLAIMQALRLMRANTALAAMAKAETRNPLMSNIVRVMVLPISLGVAILTGNIFLMIASGIGAELVAALFSAWLARRNIGLAPAHFLVTVFSGLAAMVAIVGVTMMGISWLILLPAVAVAGFAARRLLSDYKMLLRS